MSKYIEQSKVNDEIVRVLEHTDCKDEYIDRVLMAIESLPTIDIVRCRECKYYEDPNHKIFENCVKWKDSHGIILPIKPNDSCSYGERIEA